MSWDWLNKNLDVDAIYCVAFHLNKIELSLVPKVVFLGREMPPPPPKIIRVNICWKFSQSGIPCQDENEDLGHRWILGVDTQKAEAREWRQ